jgi:uncharacterized protein (DUF58 family)
VRDQRFIDPRTLARIRDLPLAARAVADGFLHGVQPSQQRGVGVEFSQYRAYEPGDDPGRIDWKLHARSDRYFVREAERESETDIWFVLDCSGSMAQRSEAGAWDKFEYARFLVAALAWLAHRQGDRVGLLALGEDGPVLVPAAGGDRQWHRILQALQRLQAAGGFRAGAARRAMARLQAAGLVFAVSDFHERTEEITAFVTRLSTSRNEVAALRLLCADELAFPYRGPVRFEDLESGESVLVSARTARELYLERFRQREERLGAALAAAEVSLDSFDIDQPLDRAMHRFLERRSRRLP